MRDNVRHKLSKAMHLSVFGLLVGGTLGMFAFQVIFEGKVAPNTFALNTNISFQHAEEAQETYSAALEAFEQTPVTVQFKGETHTFTLSELGITLLKTESINNIPVLSPAQAPWEMTDTIIGGKEVHAAFEIALEIFQSTLESRIINLNVAAKEPLITWNASHNDFDIVTEQNGWAADLENFQQTLEQQIATLDSSSLEIIAIETFPQSTADELQLAKAVLDEKLTQSTTIFTEEDEWTIQWRDNMHLLNFEPTTDNEGSTIAIKVDPTLLQEHIARYIAPEVEIQSQDVTIIMDEEGKISFEGTAIDGLAIHYGNLTEFLNIALDQAIQQVEIPFETTRAQVNSPEELQELGIQELVVTGYSNFWGSPYNRRHNINVAMEQFDGTLIEPGATFSFGDQLGLVDGSTGYAKELVIKENETIPEYGGGVCQVSSTLFRAILFGGYPIVERKAHSYAVSYYAYPLGWGLDATVYPPAVDLKFINDSNHHLLIQSYTEDNDAYFKFYGTKDGRTVDMDGPYISDRATPPDPIYEVTSELEPDIIEQKDTAHNGFTATWSRTVIYPENHPEHIDGHTTTESIISPYQAWPAKYLVGEGTEGYEED